MRYFVRVGNGNRIKAFSWADAQMIAAKTGGKVVSVPLNR